MHSAVPLTQLLRTAPIIQLQQAFMMPWATKIAP